jgi:uncharacterized protein (DUF1697 family)
MLPIRIPSTHIALLRGVNLGGKNLLPMKDLAVMFEKAGCSDVRTYTQSGNVIFKAPASVVSGLAAKMAKHIQHRFGLAVHLVLRSREQGSDKHATFAPFASERSFITSQAPADRSL